MVGPEAESELLWRFSSERRRFERHDLVVPAAVHGPRGVLPVETVNVSLSGVLLRLACPPSDGARGTPATLEAVERLLGASFQIRLAGSAVTTRARLVRVVRPAEDPDSLLLGCQFAINLHQNHLRRLGIDPATCRCGHQVLETPTTILPLDLDERAGVDVVVHDADRREEEPVCSGRLVHLGGLVMTAQVDPEAPGRVAPRLDGRPLGVRVLHQEEELWAVGARLLAVRLLPEARSAAEVALLTEAQPGPDVRARFRPRENPAPAA